MTRRVDGDCAVHDGFCCFSRPEPLMRGICDVTSHYDMMTNGMVRQLVVFRYEVFLASPVCAM
eukprot:COSAG04_NODE_231_length_19199_cov_263.690209_16_plen_63_part_00